jgi:ectoine hydroxylase-related dioxygenase (phytanoyl-CoA dioxygenase family)
VVAGLREQLEAQGYAVVREVIERPKLNDVVTDIERHAGIGVDEPSTWYDRLQPNGVLEMYHYPSMWAVRQNERLHSAFAEVFGTEKLWVSIDRVAAKPPADDSRADCDLHGFIHWDTDVGMYPDVPFEVQGVLALTDTDVTMGGFQCVPALFKQLPEWLRRQDKSFDRRKPNVDGFDVEAVAAEAGDLIIWHSLLPHGNGRNRSSRLRLCQYVTMMPADQDNTVRRENRIWSWENSQPGWGYVAARDERPFRAEHHELHARAELSRLGRRLLGIDWWS